MTARGRRFLARLVTTLVAGLAGILTVGALPAAADTVGIGQYVALGDSYAAGQGGSLAYDNKCLRSPNGYPALLDAENQIHLRANAACTGATTSDVADKQLSALKQGTRLVTLTVGAADLGLSKVLAACTAVPPTPTDCQTAITNARALLAVPPGGQSVLGGRLTDLYAEVADAAPNALIVVTGYPLLFELVQRDPNFALKAQINNATAALNLTIKTAVKSAQNSGINIVYVDVTHAFDGHGIGGSEKPLFINPPEAGINAFHPTPAGYLAYAAAISAALPSSWGANQEQVA